MSIDTPGRSTPVSKSELVYREVRKRILDGRYSIGYRLVLHQVAAELGVSTVPVREAIRRLEAEQLVRYTHNVGAEVAGIDLSQYGDAMELLAVLEGSATALAAPMLSDAELTKARDLNAQLRAMLGRFNPLEFTAINHEFHRLLTAPCPNTRLLALLQREAEGMAQIRRSSFLEVPERAEQSVAEHAGLLDLISSGAPTSDIESAARAHKMATRNAFLAHRRAGKV